MKTSITFFFVIGWCLLASAQVPVEFTFSSSSRDYSSLDRSIGVNPIDSANYKFDLETYRINYFLDSTSHIDSVYRYFEDGTISYKGYCINVAIDTFYLPPTVYQGVTYLNPRIGVLADIYEKTFYEDFGKLRSSMYRGYYKKKYLNSQMTFYSPNGLPVYEEILFFEDTLKGSFFKYFGDSIPEIDRYGLQVYKNGQLVETWYLQNLLNAHIDPLMVTKIVLHDQKRTLVTRKELMQKLKATKVYLFQYKIYIGNL
ncbi:MAG: hypothetical protein V4604_14480 [Bacteroidota bacterium]